MRRLRNSRGFTLLELIVTLTILGLVFSMILGALRLGSSSWERGEEKAETSQKRRIVFNLISQQIKSSFPYKTKSQKAEPDYLVFSGSSDSLRFVSTFSLRAKRPEGLVFVIYELKEGKSPGKTLRVYEKRLLTKDIMGETPEEEKFMTLVEGLSDVKFEYFSEEEAEKGEWVEAWDGKEKTALPRQIRMTLKWKERKEVEETLPVLVTLPAYMYDDRRKAGVRTIQRPAARRVR